MRDLLERIGGVATYGQLRSRCARAQIEDAVASGELLRLSRGRFALPTAREARRAAHQLSGVAVGLSAAMSWGWAAKWQPRRPQVAVPRGRRVSRDLQGLYDVSWRRLEAVRVVDGWVTSPLQTVVDCARLLPFDEGLSVADSALRSGRLTEAHLKQAADDVRGPGRPQVLRVLSEASGLAANPFESVLRAISLDVPGIRMVPQVRLVTASSGKFLGRVDLADEALRIVAEADSFEFHGEREQLERDCLRYDDLTVEGWLALRFAWLHVMKRQPRVRGLLEGARDRQLRAGLHSDDHT